VLIKAGLSQALYFIAALFFQIYLFENGSKYFIKTLDQEALIECFVSSFRLHPEKDNLIKLCATANSSIHHQMTLVQAMHYISTQVFELLGSILHLLENMFDRKRIFELLNY